MANAFDIKIDFEPARVLADKLDQISRAGLLRLSAVDAVNEVTTRFDKQARAAMNAGLNLSDAYISSRVRVTKAAATGQGSVRAEIVTRGDLTIIGHYPHAQLRSAGTQTRQGATRGRRPSGVAVEIKKGGAIDEPQWFTMRLRQGSQSGDKTGLFVRTSAGRVKHLYGPSPYSLFRFQINKGQAELEDDLFRTSSRRAADSIERALA